MPKNIPISRAKRLQWLLDHLNSIITVPNNLQNVSKHYACANVILITNKILDRKFK